MYCVNSIDAYDNCWKTLLPEARRYQERKRFALTQITTCAISDYLRSTAW